MSEENNKKLDKSIDWEKTALLTDSDEENVYLVSDVINHNNL